jgi:hypothetical protein
LYLSAHALQASIVIPFSIMLATNFCISESSPTSFEDPPHLIFPFYSPHFSNLNLTLIISHIQRYCTKDVYTHHPGCP